MPPKTLLRRELVGGLTTETKTKNLRHLLSHPKQWATKVTRATSAVKSAHHEDRIKWWNIVPGDRVRVSGDPKGTIREVAAINKFSNRVFLKNGDENNARHKNVSYSLCQLLVGHVGFPPPEGKTEPVDRPVFAKRVSISKPVFRDGFWQWHRYAVTTTPRLPPEAAEALANEDSRLREGGLVRYRIKWPKEQEKRKTTAGAQDTLSEEVHKITYRLPAINGPPAKDLYTKYIRMPPEERQSALKAGRTAARKAGTIGPDDVKTDIMKMELGVYRELSPPTSRANRQKRWQEQQASDKALLEQYIKAEEAKDRFGRSKKEARAVAVYKWRIKVHGDRKKVEMRRWVKRGGLARKEKKERQKEKKEVRRSRTLANLVLGDAPNQVAPATL